MRNNYLYDKINNCLICTDAQIHKNEVSTLLRKIGCAKLADTLDSMFPVVFCGKNGKYIANPMKRPEWCERAGKP